MFLSKVLLKNNLEIFDQSFRLAFQNSEWLGFVYHTVMVVIMMVDLAPIDPFAH